MKPDLVVLSRSLSRSAFTNGQGGALTEAAILADRSGTYEECLSLAKQYYALSISAEMKDGQMSTLENLRNILRTKTSPQVHRKDRK